MEVVSYGNQAIVNKMKRKENLEIELNSGNSSEQKQQQQQPQQKQQVVTSPNGNTILKSW